LLRRDLKKIEKDLEVLDHARDKLNEVSRTATRLADWAVIQMHRGELGKAKESLATAKNSLRQMERLLKENPELKHSGNVLVAYQEYAEAKLLLHIITDGELPSMEAVGTDSIPFVLGILDLVGELRRMALNFLRKGKVMEAERILRIMERAYEDVFSIDHTAIIPTFRNKMDVARKLIEITRGEVVTEIRRLSLEEAITSFRGERKEKKNAET